MYIVQVKPHGLSWRKLEHHKCEFRTLGPAITLYRSICHSALTLGMDVRIWSTQSEHRVEVD
jgi:hypothetical protein